jgi:glycine rich protein/Big-like domain-containing protein/all-beta uncharacterized protein/F5/8 type C domain-containing protein/BACON domain-containing protein
MRIRRPLLLPLIAALFVTGAVVPTHTALTVNVLVVAGGGGGGAFGAGGGAGGAVWDAGHVVAAAAFPVVVGSGGAGSAGTSTRGASGSDSTFDTITARGGGGGGSQFATSGAAGGSGGGGFADGGSGAAGGASTQSGSGGGTGYGSGGGSAPGQAVGGGGGGLGAVGANGQYPTPTVGGNGGAGRTFTVGGIAANYGGGGGGGGTAASSAGAGGSGIGGNGNVSGGNGSNATANTGSGGGGGGNGGLGGNGSAGTVVIAYVTGSLTATGGTITTSGGNTIHTFTANGTFTVGAVPAPPPGRVNVAAAVNGGTATASSTYSAAYPASGAIDGDHKGLAWGAGGAWADATLNQYPDWLEVDFAGTQTIDEIDVFSIQDNAGAPVEPTLAMPFTYYGLTDFQVQSWSGTQWVAVPGGSITGNTQVWRQVPFVPLTTSRIRVLVTGALGNLSRIAEVEAYSAPPQVPGAFAKTDPLNAGATSGTAMLTWQASSGATSYEYCVDGTNNGACDGSWVSVGGQTAVSITAVPNVYWWQVRARNATGTTDATGGWWTFTATPFSSSRRTTLCSYHFPDAADGWRSHVWTAADCSNGLPDGSWTGVGQGQNGTGTSGQIQCYPGTGYQFNNTVVAGTTDATVSCFFAAAAPQLEPNPTVTTCSYTFGDYQSGWRSHAWTAADCSNGVPAAGWLGLGYGQNGGGTAGMVDCTAAAGSHYNHPSIDGVTVGIVTCTFVDPAPRMTPNLTLCEHVFPDNAVGWRTYNWAVADCSHGLPSPLARAIGQATNGSGGPEQAACTPANGSHFNTGATVGRVRCLFENPPPAPSAPTVTMTTPAAGASFATPASIGLQASASDLDGRISKVEFYANTTLVGTALAAPYAVTYAGGSVGSYALTAKAFDDNGNATVSVAVPITIAAPCSYTLSPSSVSVASSAGASQFSVTTSSACSWAAIAQPAWLHLQPGSTATGSGTVTFTIDQSFVTLPRIGTITLAGVTFTVNQAAAPPSTASPRTTICSHHFEDAQVGWRSHAWTAADCSNGLPLSDWTGVGQGETGVGVSGQIQCYPGTGYHYNHPTWGATDATVTCFFAPPVSQAPPDPSVTTCQYTFSAYQTGWRSHNWTVADCSNGLPAPTALFLGNGQNGGGTGGMVDCAPASGSHYNHPTFDGATTGTVTCTFVNPSAPAAPSLTLCEHAFPEDVAGWRTHTWTANECSNGVPTAGAHAVGQALNGSGEPQQAYCSPTQGAHFNLDATVGRVRCLYENGVTVAPPPPPIKTTLCSYHFPEAAVGWRHRDWTASDCSNGLPGSGWVGVGQGQNSLGLSGQVQCYAWAGYEYNHPTKVGATDGTVTCLFVPPPTQAQQPSPAATTCTHTFPEAQTGWRSWNWTAPDCSNGLPPAGALWVGQGQNGGGTSGMVDCGPTYGAHYNHPTVDDATSGTVSCTFIDPIVVQAPELTLCEHFFPTNAAGWRSYNWTAADCSQGLPGAGARAVGLATNGSGGLQQAMCTPTTGSHFNVGVTVGRVRCLFENPGPACATSATPSAAAVPTSGGFGTLDVSAPGSCTWRASPDVPWITVLSTGVGQGNDAVEYATDPNTGPQRAGHITVGGRTITVSQAAGHSCFNGVFPTSAYVDGAAGSHSFALSAPGGCAWTASSDADWVTLATGAGSGSALLNYTVSPNPSTTTRTATLSIGTPGLTNGVATFVITQGPSGTGGGAGGGATSPSTLLAGQVLGTLMSPDGRFQFAYWPDGNLVLSQGSTVLWSSGTSGPGYAVMQGDGNFVRYGVSGPPWHTHTDGHPAAWLAVTNGGKAAVYSTDGSVLWSTGDGGDGFGGAGQMFVWTDIGTGIGGATQSGTANVLPAASGNLAFQGGCHYWAKDVYPSYLIKVKVSAYTDFKLIKSEPFEGRGEIEGTMTFSVPLKTNAQKGQCEGFFEFVGSTDTKYASFPIPAQQLSPTTGIFAKGRRVSVVGDSIPTGFDHVAILIKPTNQVEGIPPTSHPEYFRIDPYTGKWFATLAAESSSGCGGKIHKDISVQADLDDPALFLEKLSYVEADEDAEIEKLFERVSHFIDLELDYGCWPDPYSTIYNSNSFARGLIVAADLLPVPHTPGDNYLDYPGWTKPIPRGYFFPR